MTKIILTRHAHVEGIDPERFRGRADLVLSEVGRAQALATARHIHQKWRPAACYSSPMRRCVQTAGAIAEPHGLAIQPVPGFQDIDYGKWQGLTPIEARSQWPEELDAWYHTPHLTCAPGGESLQELLARAARELREILHRHTHDTIVLVAHDSVNRVLLLHTLDIPLSHYWRLKQEPCAINEIDTVEAGFRIRTLNETQHLPASRH